MSQCNGASYDPDTERPVVIGEYRLAIRTLHEINELVRLLRPDDVQPGWWIT